MKWTTTYWRFARMCLWGFGIVADKWQCFWTGAQWVATQEAKASVWPIHWSGPTCHRSTKKREAIWYPWFQGAPKAPEEAVDCNHKQGEVSWCCLWCSGTVPVSGSEATKWPYGCLSVCAFWLHRWILFCHDLQSLAPEIIVMAFKPICWTVATAFVQCQLYLESFVTFT